MTDNCVLVTGGAGYIGSHVALALLESGGRVVVADNLVTGRRELVPDGAEFVEIDIADMDGMARLMRETGCRAIMHFAGSTVVPESVENPLKYYRNNTSASRNLLETALEQGVDKFIFSSTAAVYGNPDKLPVDESVALAPVSPYGKSKLMTENMLQDVATASDLRFIALRYFNVAGADPDGRSGQSTPNATHLIKAACEVACGARESVTIFGDDYDTPDGTGVRDFIHVSDLAQAHVAALDHLAEGGGSNVMNCGYGRGYSVKQVLDTLRNVSGGDFRIETGPRRPGDVGEIYAESKRIRDVLGWIPQYDDLEKIVASAYAWEQRMTA
ncbi:MAG: UDP-glucose 4-epimerase GalE [Alphaproteobacteria bacterium]|nr:UDP-glucose 4-epimerase GalE [Alphaproteobacteria bacterium]